MTNAFAWGLQKAVYGALADHAALAAHLGAPPRIYDAPPKGTAFPFATLGETRVKPFRGVDGAFEHDLRVHVFSRYEGRREAKEILNGVYDALHEADFSVDGASLVQIRFVFADIFPRTDGGVFQGVARFRAVTQTL